MAERPVAPWIKFALEFGPIIAFFVAYIRLKDDTFAWGGTDYDGFIVVTALFIPLFLVATGILWALTGRLSRMQVLTTVVVVVFGGLGIWFNDERFFKMKPTVIYLIFAGILWFGLLRGQSYLAFLMEDMMPIARAGWMTFTRRLAWFFLGLAIANEAVWRLMSTDAWVNFKTFVLPLALMAFMATQFPMLQRHALPDDKK